MNRKITGLYYITHIDNLESILKHGILSHAEVERRNIDFKTIYDGQIVSRRKNITTPANESLWNYANFYFQPRNPMLYRIMREVPKAKSEIIVIKVKKSLLNRHDLFITNGNAAHSVSEIFPISKSILDEISEELTKKYWNEEDGSKRKIMAECLVPNLVKPENIECVYVARAENGANEKTRNILANHNLKLNVVPEPEMFFQPDSIYPITNNLSLIKGDMFFSNMQTLTISVNTVGVMGKGLASRAKYQFPDLYVTYQDYCKAKKLEVGKPMLVVREASLSSQLSEIPLEGSQPTWFLLFPTKKHWKEKSKIEYVVDGMAWLEQNYKKWKITSLALPALGCGLGTLEWEEVGPIICSVASRFGIPVSVYLPAENKKSIEHQYLTANYLLKLR